VRVCLLDSGVDRAHSMVGAVDRSVAISVQDGEVKVDEVDDDLVGHGTACAGIIRSIAPDCEISSMRVLGPRNTGSGSALLAALQWAVGEGFDVVNMSLSTTKRDLVSILHELADLAYFRGTMLVSSAHNMRVESFPWRFASVISVGSHEGDDPLTFFYNPDPPVEFFARGVDIEVAWLGGGRIVATGNSFATAHITGICALILGKHPGLTPFDLKSVLCLTANNIGEEA
jgi:subtilisin family serine protease